MPIRKILFAISVALPLTACGADAVPAEEQVSTENSQISLVSVADASALINRQNDSIILDVRTPGEFDSGHIENAQNIDFKADDFAQKLKELDQDKSYIVYCGSGKRSGKATAQMKTLDFKNITDVDGGITAWKSAELPLIM